MISPIALKVRTVTCKPAAQKICPWLPPVTLFIPVSCVSLYRSHSRTLAVPHKYAAVEIPASYFHWKTAKSTFILFESRKKWQRFLPWVLHSELSTEKVAQQKCGSVPHTQTWGQLEAPSESGTGKHKARARLSQPALLKLCSTRISGLSGALQSQSHKLWPQ